MGEKYSITKPRFIDLGQLVQVNLATLVAAKV